MQRSLKLLYRKSFQLLSLVAAQVACSALPGSGINGNYYTVLCFQDLVWRLYCILIKVTLVSLNTYHTTNLIETNPFPSHLQYKVKFSIVLQNFRTWYKRSWKRYHDFISPEFFCAGNKLRWMLNVGPQLILTLNYRTALINFAVSLIVSIKSTWWA